MMLPFLEKAEENIQAANLCFAQGYINACANRAYYAMYHAALAALIHYEYAIASGANKHEWVQSEFAKRLIKERKIYPGLQEYLMQGQELRNKADYQQEFISQKRAQRVLSKAKEFVTIIKEDLT